MIFLEQGAKKETRNTKQKNLIIDTLKEYSDEHLSVDKLFDIMKAKDPHIGIATVYRNLKLLEDQGYIRKLLFADNVAPCYEVIGNSLAHTHHHLICEKCGEIVDFEEDLLDAIEKIIQVTKDFTISDHKVIFYGTCSKCKNESKDKPAK